MNKVFIILCLVFSNFTFSQQQNTEDKDTIYFNLDNKPLTKTEFESKIQKENLLAILGDSVHHRKLSVREQHGSLQNKYVLDSLMTKLTKGNIDLTKTQIIIYHPGEDSCNKNMTPATNPNHKKMWFKKLHNKLKRITGTKPIYIYKDNKNLDKIDPLNTYLKDPEGTIERLFFKHHYPCVSFVAISKNGEYISYFGEFSKEHVWRAAKLLTIKSKK